MQFNEDQYSDGDISSDLLQKSKKRRIQRACDVCRRKKIRCDGVETLDNRCSNCISFRSNCTYIEAAKKRGPIKGYVENLENKVEKLEKLIQQLCPDKTLRMKLYESLDGIVLPPVGDSATKAQPKASDLETVASAILGAIEVNPDTTRSSTDPLDDDDPTLSLAGDLERMALTQDASRFIGESSGAMLLHTAIDLKNECKGDAAMIGSPKKSALTNPRAVFFTVRPWEQKSDASSSPKYDFPDPDLALHCVDLYFKFSNLYLPLLHRPTFDKCLHKGLHLKNESFASVFLLVCAVGARFSDDPRVLLDRKDNHYSSGWEWFEQVQILTRESLLAPPSLYELQLYCLCAQYLLGSSVPQSCWAVVGVGIRLAQDAGAHRRKAHNHTHTPEDELWKRAFWVLVCMDRINSSSMGRSCAIQDEDFDLDLPLDCDDEYWDNPDPEKCFEQPPNKPSLVAAFILYLKLHQILAFCLRTIYSINKSKILLGFVRQPWEQHIVAELDSALNKWEDSVPDHLRWDPHRADDNFFNQSVYLYVIYYHIRIMVHRPFIPLPNKPSPLSFPSLPICTNAARSCSHVVDIQRGRNPKPPPLIQMPVFTSGVIILLGIWAGKSSGLSTDPNKEMTNIHKCMNMLKTLEARWHSAGKLWDVLRELAYHPQPEMQLLQRHPLTKHWYAMRASSQGGEPTPHASSSGVILSHWPHHPPAPAPQQEQLRPRYHNHTSPSIRTNSFSSIPEISSMTQGPYGMDSGQMATNIMIDPAGPLAYTQQQTSTYGLGPTDSLSPAVGSSSLAPSPQSNLGSSMEKVYGGVPLDMLPDPSAGLSFHQQQHQGVPQRQERQSLTYPFVVATDPAEMWSNAPAEFELGNWGSYLTNTELMQGYEQRPPFI